MGTGTQGGHKGRVQGFWIIGVYWGTGGRGGHRAKGSKGRRKDPLRGRQLT